MTKIIATEEVDFLSIILLMIYIITKKEIDWLRVRLVYRFRNYRSYFIILVLLFCPQLYVGVGGWAKFYPYGNTLMRQASITRANQNMIPDFVINELFSSIT